MSSLVDTSLNGDTIHIMADMYMSDAIWRSVSLDQTSGSFIMSNDVLTLPHAVEEIISILIVLMLPKVSFLTTVTQIQHTKMLH